MGMKPTVPDDGSIQQQIGTAYDVVKSVADNLPAILAVTEAVTNAQEVIASITEQVELATEAANNANQVVSNITGLVNQAENAKNTTEIYRDNAQVIKNDVIAIRDDIIPEITDFQSKWPTFTANYTDTVSKHSAIVTMYADVDADRIAAENARNKAQLWANAAVDVPVESGLFSAAHWATKASAFNTLAQGYASTATQKATEANQSALNAATSASTVNTHLSTIEGYVAEINSDVITVNNAVTTTTTKATEAATSASNAATSATSASTSASTATTQAGIATTQANNANTSATNANTSMLLAQDWAIKPVDVVVSSGEYSSKHYATKAASDRSLAVTAKNEAQAATTTATTQANNATTSATNASNAESATIGYRDTTLTYKNEAWSYREDARIYAENAAAIVGGNFVPFTRTINGIALTDDITLTPANINAQPVDADLTAIASLGTNSGLLRKTAVDTWTLDTTSYLTANQSITFTGDATGTGATAVTLTLANSGVTAGTYKSVTVDAKGRVTAGTNPTTLAGYGITDAQPLDATLTAVAGVTTAADTYVYFTGVDAATSGTITSFGRSLIDDVDATAARTTLGLGTAATQASTAFQTAATQLTTLVTNINAAGSGIFKKTAANTWSFTALATTDIPNLDVAKITTGTLSVGRGGTGVTTITGLLKGNGTGAFTVAVSGTDIKTINGATLIGSGNVDLGGAVNGLLKCNGAGTYAKAVAGTDYVIPSGSITGNAATATKLATARTINGVSFDGSTNITIPAPASVATADALTTARVITVTGDADWTVNFKGDASVSAAMTLKDVVAANTGTKITFNSKGLVTGFSSLSDTDIPNLDWSKITTGVPTFALQSDARFTDSREWSADTATISDITGSNTTRKAYTGAVIKAAIDDIAAPKTSTHDRLVALENAPDSGAVARKALALAILGM